MMIKKFIGMSVLSLSLLVGMTSGSALASASASTNSTSTIGESSFFIESAQSKYVRFVDRIVAGKEIPPTKSYKEPAADGSWRGTLQLESVEKQVGDNTGVVWYYAVYTGTVYFYGTN
ncbi:hypothetical protein DCC85_22710 [Paenibacillus sp. CAA11]|uniref:hypothetical protein n=1 Tax=Paenibacillus sp. CAA11 TaxID=1532905 RepID=UPI000D3B552A|nr:hypothetical protein [Paenibacillus sp. CAA11]AWB46707.1 hypothetical protein DCC85_22710 [Paenibacillus sp. CAA11]